MLLDQNNSQQVDFCYNEKVHFFKSLGSVVELVDAPHSKCGTFGYVGSSPTAPTLMNTYSRFDISFKKGKGCWLWDKTGKRYLDAVAGIATVSYTHLTLPTILLV